MDHREKLELIEKEIDEANRGSPADFNLWRERTDVTLRNVLGDANPLYARFCAINYSLSVWSVDTPQSAVDRAREAGVREAVAILEAAKLEVEVSGGVPQPSVGAQPAGRTVFVVHGRDESRKHLVARFLSKVTGNEPVILHEQSNQGRTIIEKFEDHAADAGYAVVLLTADDLGRSSDEDLDAERPRARQNVIFEMGFFFGALGRRRVAMLFDDGVERPSDTDGIVRIPIDDAGAWMLVLARELHAAGIGINWPALGGG